MGMCGLSEALSGGLRLQVVAELACLLGAEFWVCERSLSSWVSMCWLENPIGKPEGTRCPESFLTWLTDLVNFES